MSVGSGKMMSGPGSAELNDQPSTAGRMMLAYEPVVVHMTPDKVTYTRNDGTPWKGNPETHLESRAQVLEREGITPEPPPIAGDGERYVLSD